MATNKHATIRYQALDKCFRNPGRRYYIDDLSFSINNQPLSDTETLIFKQNRGNMPQY